MTKTLTALIPGPLTITVTDVETPHYEGVPADALLPPRGEDVWVDHPIFDRDKTLADAVVGSGLTAVIEAADPAYTERNAETEDWINGRIPIPLHRLDSLLQTRAFIAVSEGIPYSDLPPVRSPADSEGLLFDSIPCPEIAEPHYEGCDPEALLPQPPEDVWIDHPIFLRCPLFAANIAIKRDKATDPSEQDWLIGRKPIPNRELDELIATRRKEGEYVGFKVLPAQIAA